MSPGKKRPSHTGDSPWRLDSKQDETFMSFNAKIAN